MYSDVSIYRYYSNLFINLSYQYLIINSMKMRIDFNSAMNKVSLILTIMQLTIEEWMISQ